jgi:tRNA threonylcarbamoyladenosine biosynthesis protein TsaE
MAKIKTFNLKTISDLPVVVDFLTPFLMSNTLILLDGPMAAGKTTLISELLKKIGVFETHSPTYALHHKYKANSFDIHHFDLHRLASPDDIESSGFWDFFDSSQDLFIVEWSKHISFDQWPLNFKIVRIVIEKNLNENRTFLIEFVN